MRAQLHRRSGVVLISYDKEFESYSDRTHGMEDYDLEGKTALD